MKKGSVMGKDELIKTVVEKYYKNFPELIEKFSEGEIYKRLNNNITSVEFVDKLEKGQIGEYSTTTGKVKIIKQDNQLFNEINTVHEFTHALFRRGDYNSGCTELSKNIKDFKLQKIDFKKFVSYYSHKNVLDKIRLLVNSYIYRPNRRVALNEGFTEWIVYKTMGKKLRGAYESEWNIIRQLECFLDKKDILDIGDGNPSRIAKIFNMNRYDFEHFSDLMDERLSLEENRYRKNSDIKKDEIEALDKSISEKALEIQEMMFENVIFPKMEKTLKSKEVNFKKFWNINPRICDFIKLNNINRDNPSINKFFKLYDKCREKNNQELLKSVEDLKGENGKFNVFDLGDTIKKYSLFDDGTDIKLAEMVLDKKVNQEEADKFLIEFRQLHKAEKDKLVGKIEKNEEFKFELIDREKFTYDFREEQPKEKKKSFLRKFVDKVISTKKITMEQVDKCEPEEINIKQEKGEESIEK